MKTNFSPSNNSWRDVAIVAIIVLVMVAFFVLLNKMKTITLMLAANQLVARWATRNVTRMERKSK